MFDGSEGEREINYAAVFAPFWAEDAINARYLGAFGGRGSGKSHDAALRLVSRMISEPDLRAVCLREVQNSIRDSVHQLLIDWIKNLGLLHTFKITREQIAHQGGAFVIFKGMKDQNAASIKSLEGFNIAWFEEAQTMSAMSLELLRPTMRRDGSQIWFTWNPSAKTDPVDLFLRARTPDDAIVVRANYSDNPWFPKTLEGERQLDLAADPDRYRHIWEGAYLELSDKQLISTRVVEEARKRTPETFPQDETVMGVDVARYGDDESCVVIRRGRDAYTEDWHTWRKLDTMEVAARVADLMTIHRPDACFIDETGVGAGVVDRLLQLGMDVTPVNFAMKPTGLTTEKAANKRAEMWLRMRDWLRSGGAIQDSDRLEAELTGLEYKHDANNAILLEKKEDMKKRGLPSPDRADALALTFAFPVSHEQYDDYDDGRGDQGRNAVTGY